MNVDLQWLASLAKLLARWRETSIYLFFNTSLPDLLAFSLIRAAITFLNGGKSTMLDGGGIYLRHGAVVNIVLCVFQNCGAYGSGVGGAIYASTYEGALVLNLLATHFVDNVAPDGQGADIGELAAL